MGELREAAKLAFYPQRHLEARTFRRQPHNLPVIPFHNIARLESNIKESLVHIQKSNAVYNSEGIYTPQYGQHPKNICKNVVLPGTKQYCAFFGN